MPRAVRVDRTCLVCDAEFTGTPKATRCPTCKAEGKRVPIERQSQRGKAPKVRTVYDLTCFACGDQFDSARSNSIRCPGCIEAGKLAKFRTCRSCETRYPGLEGSHPEFCANCYDPKLVRTIDLNSMDQEWREHLARERKQAIQDKMDLLNQIIERHHPTPKKRRKRRSSKVFYLERLLAPLITNHPPASPTRPLQATA